MTARLLVVVALWVAAPLAAQVNSGQLTADAVVVGGPITVTSLRDLTFGTVPKGVTTTIAPEAANAGHWQVSGSPNAFVGITFSLSVALDNIHRGVSRRRPRGLRLDGCPGPLPG
jgi:hypothetical protein